MLGGGWSCRLAVNDSYTLKLQRVNITYKACHNSEEIVTIELGMCVKYNF